MGAVIFGAGATDLGWTMTMSSAVEIIDKNVKKQHTLDWRARSQDEPPTDARKPRGVQPGLRPESAAASTGRVGYQRHAVGLALRQRFQMNATTIRKYE